VPFGPKRFRLKRPCASGLVNHVYEPGELLAAAEALANKIASNAPLAVRYAMEAIERSAEMPQQEGMFLEATLFGLSAGTEDFRRRHGARSSKNDRRYSAAMRRESHTRDTRGSATAEELRFGIVVARFNSFHYRAIARGRLLMRCAPPALPKQRSKIVRVPGSFEIPLAARSSPKPGAPMPSSPSAASCAATLRTSTISLPKLLADYSSRKWTPAFRWIFLRAHLRYARSGHRSRGLKSGNKGQEAALAAVEMANLSLALKPSLPFREDGGQSCAKSHRHRAGKTAPASRRRKRHS